WVVIFVKDIPDGAVRARTPRQASDLGIGTGLPRRNRADNAENASPKRE
ncbi:MAG: hypothetical protein Greene041679_693, partial [Parcubacteria group bacterium Greene0416_79]